MSSVLINSGLLASESVLDVNYLSRRSSLASQADDGNGNSMRKRGLFSTSSVPQWRVGLATHLASKRVCSELGTAT